MACALDIDDYFKISPDLRDLNYGKYYDSGDINLAETEEYTSHNTERLDVNGMIRLLEKLKFVSAFRSGSVIEPEES